MVNIKLSGQKRFLNLSIYQKESILRILSDQLIWIILIFLFIIISIVEPIFLSRINIINILLHSAVLGIMVIGESICLISGKFDLSIESTLGFTAMLGAILVVDFGWNPYLTILLVLGLGIFIGYLNSLMIIKLKIDPFVVTLGMLIVLRGLSLVISGGYTRYNFPAAFKFFAAHTKSGLISVPILLMLFCYVVFSTILYRQKFGRHLYAVGGNIDAAYTSGVNVSKVITKAFLISGFLAALSGLVLSSRLNSVPTTLGKGMVFEVMAAAVIGGISLQGGRGSLLGALGGVLLMSSIDSALTLTRVSAFWVETSKGLLLLTAVFLDTLKIRLIPLLRRSWLED